MQMKSIGGSNDVTVSIDSGWPSANRLRERVKIGVEKEMSKKKSMDKYIRGEHINNK